MTHETNEPEKNDQRATQGLDPAPVDEPCRVVVVPLASGQSVTVSMRSVTWPTGEGRASFRSTPEDLNQAAGGSGPGGVTRREEIAQAILAWFHDGSTTEWPGEIDAYRSLAGHLLAAGGLGADRDSRFRWAEEAAEADVRAVSEQARANVLAWLHAEAAWKRDQFRDSAVMYAARVAELNAELAGLRERAVILTKRVRYAYDGDTWDGWLVTLTVAETGTQATVRRDNGEDWVVMARNITEIEGTPDVPQ